MTDDPAPAATITRLALRTSDDLDLRAEIASPPQPTATGAATTGATGMTDTMVKTAVVVCHPHPLHGGSMYANVVETLFTGLPAEGAPVLRFNFRGVTGSEGRHDQGRGEQLDAAAAVNEVHRRWPDAGVVLAGYSFGADVALTIDHPAITAWLLVAPPLRVVPVDKMAALPDPRPKRFLVGAHDQFCGIEHLTATVSGHPATDVRKIDGADHFFAVGLGDILTAATDLLAA